MDRDDVEVSDIESSLTNTMVEKANSPRKELYSRSADEGNWVVTPCLLDKNSAQRYPERWYFFLLNASISVKERLTRPFFFHQRIFWTQIENGDS